MDQTITVPQEALSPAVGEAITAYIALLKYADVNGQCVLSLARMESLTGKERRTLKKWLDRLKEAGLIDWVRVPQEVNQTMREYTILALAPKPRRRALDD